jgi:hypothetical protein
MMKDITYPNVRSLYRIPFTILTGNMPDGLQGTRISTLTSNVDVPPTILHLLGMDKTAQQFMGVNAFSRNEDPIFTNWFESVLKLVPTGADPTIMKVEPELERGAAAVGNYNLYAPPAADRQEIR